jgi:uncharacterized protein (TIGR03067 family)
VNASLVLGLAFLVGAPVGKPAPKTAEPPTLVGVWATESFRVDGEVQDSAGMTLEFTPQGRLVARKDGEVEEEGTFTTSPAKDPAELDWIGDDGSERLPGIYRFDGELLLICLRTNPSGSRPTNFDAPSGSECVLLTFKRVAKKKG